VAGKEVVTVAICEVNVLRDNTKASKLNLQESAKAGAWMAGSAEATEATEAATVAFCEISVLQ
jgi:hypothetical protein